MPKVEVKVYRVMCDQDDCHRHTTIFGRDPLPPGWKYVNSTWYGACGPNQDGLEVERVYCPQHATEKMLRESRP